MLECACVLVCVCTCGVCVYTLGYYLCITLHRTLFQNHYFRELSVKNFSKVEEEGGIFFFFSKTILDILASY